MSKRKALGKGLRSLIPDAPPPKPAPTPAAPDTESQAAAGPTSVDRGGLRELDIDRVRPNARQPRGHFADAALKELSESLREQGVLQPIVVRPVTGGDFELIAGERRWRAAQMAGLLKVPAVVRAVSDDSMLELALIENIQREELNPIEVALALQALMDDLDLSQEEVAERVGKPRSTVANYVRLLNLAAGVREWVVQGQLSMGHAKALAAVAQPKLQEEVAKKIVEGGLNVRDAERLVAKTVRPPAASSAEPSGEPDPNVAAAEQQLQSAIGTRCKIVQRGERGRIELHFFSHEEMERVFQLLLDAGR